MPPPKKKTVARKSISRKGKKQHFFKGWKIAVAGLLLILLSPFYYGYVVKFASTSWFWLRHRSDDKNYRTYKSFNIKIPKKYTVHGIDVSRWQGRVNWQKVKAMKDGDVKITFAFIKATEGILNVDPYFQRNWREAIKAEIKVGAYHFFRPTKSGLWQANFFLQTVDLEKGDLPPVVDIESLDGVTPEKMRKELNAFIIQIENKTKVKPIIYSGLKFYKTHLKGYYDDYPLWVAHYYQPKLKLAVSDWEFWQHSDKARVNGINHIVDFNVFNGDSLKFEKFLIQ